MVNASLTTLSSYRKCSKRRILDRSAQTTSLPPIEDTMKCSRIARGFAFGSSTGFAAEVKPKAGLGVKASAAFTVCEREFHALKFSALAEHFFTNQTQGRVYLSCERQPETDGSSFRSVAATNLSTVSRSWPANTTVKARASHAFTKTASYAGGSS
jgi:hypothetical protein